MSDSFDLTVTERSVDIARYDDPAFLADGMLGTLATKLRILGFDTLYDKTSNDNTLLKIAFETKRYLLTSDIELFVLSRRKGMRSILITSRDDLSSLVELFVKLGFPRIEPRRTSRCSVCNGILKESRTTTRDGKDIYTCVVCNKNYWKGSHWKKLEALFALANSKLAAARIEGSKKGGPKAIESK